MRHAVMCLCQAIGMVWVNRAIAVAVIWISQNIITSPNFNHRHRCRSNTDLDEEAEAEVETEVEVVLTEEEVDQEEAVLDLLRLLQDLTPLHRARRNHQRRRLDLLQALHRRRQHRLGLLRILLTRPSHRLDLRPQSRHSEQLVFGAQALQLD